MIMKMKNLKRLSAIGFALAFSVHAETKIDRAPLQIGTNLDLGQIVAGRNGYRDKDTVLSFQMIERIGVMLTQSTTINDRLTVKIGVGGMFYYSAPEDKTQAASRATQFGPGVGQAQGIYKLGDLETPWTFQFGLFPYKYNADAKNLGEYLMRSGTYPGYLVTGGWNIINSANYMASGLRINKELWDKKINFDLNVFMERDIEPLYDLSPSFHLNIKPADVFELGGGVVFAHLLPAKKSKVSPADDFFRIKDDTLARTKDDTLATVSDTTGLTYFTFQGIKLDLHAAINLGAVLDNEWIGKNNLKLYGEVALLGVKDYPFFYENKFARMPMMLGFNWPTFKIFDVLATEVEYRKWEFANDIYQVLDNAKPFWNVPGNNPSTYNKNIGAGKNWTKQTNIKWTVYAKRKLMNGINVYAQVASDHMRSIRPVEVTPERIPLTRTPTQWYYLIRLEMGL